MTAKKNSQDTLHEVEDRFIENWGDISALWGVNRSMGRIHALLFLAPDPLSMEEVATRLQISHGNVSTSVRDLLAWGVIKRVHQSGERKILYEAEQDPWTWFHTCIRERRRREVEPVRENLHEVKDFARQAAKEHKDSAEGRKLAITQAKVENFTKYVDEFADLIDAFLSMGSGTIGKFFRLAAKFVPKRKDLARK
ncbi:MAG: MarR family transcriptional regulator [Planctomycetes bacterium]|nr:MarR family transcriptional regulator [Planctomycetota bacterium]